MLPLAMPAFVVVGIFQFTNIWNEFLFGFILGGNNVQTMPVALATETYTEYGFDWPYVASMSVVNLVPLLILLYFFQKYLLVGMTFGTVRNEI